MRPSQPVPKVNALLARVPVTVTPIVMVRDAAGVSIEQLTVDDWAPRFRGIAGKAVGIFLVNADSDANPWLLRDYVFADNELDVQRVQTAEVVD